MADIKHPEISNEKLLADIENTIIEKEAYEKLAEGYAALARLPENAGADTTMHQFKANGFSLNAEKCRKFLNYLQGLKAERKL